MARILVVDDEPEIVSLTKWILEKEGHEVVAAMDGKECMEVLDKDKPDLILLDIMMPGMNGWKILRGIRGMEGTTGIPVIIFSVKDPTGELLSKKEGLGFVDYIVKPFNYKDLLKRIQRVIDTKENL